MKRLTAEQASMMVAFFRLIVEMLTVNDGQKRVIVVIDPAEVGAEKTQEIVGLSRWHRMVGGQK